MRKIWRQFILTGFACLLLFFAYVEHGFTQGQNNKKVDRGNLQQRIDFGNAYIMGQSIKSGAVYLLHRKQSNINSMLNCRQDYRREILEDFDVRHFTSSGLETNNAKTAQKNGDR